MMIRTHSEPGFGELDRVGRLFESFFAAPARPQTGFLPMDILEKEDALILRAPFPGAEPGSVDVRLEGRVLTISGGQADEALFQDAKVYRREVATAEATRSIRLPEGLNLEGITAEFRNGLLTVRIPRREPAQRTIQIQVDSPAIEAEPQA
ncbi:MAG: Hsp20/alpha crystallin family protein [Fimbriimonadaceae bacterium]|nr:Hsp20/alpha crystallin family protein [Fimbriimonadaceae bacterium]